MAFTANGYYYGFLRLKVNFFLQVQELGLQTAYSGDDATYQYIRKLMALPFLPHSKIQSVFQRLTLQAETEPLQKLVDYMKNQWIESSDFPPRNWSVFKQPIRTNNDTEGWHNALNRRAGGHSGLPLYTLVELLDKEAKLTAVAIRLVSAEKLKRIQRKKYRNLQAKLFDSWDKYDKKEKTIDQLLKTCARLNGPARDNSARAQ